MVVSAFVRAVVGSFSGLPHGAKIPAMVTVGCIGSTVIYETFVIPKNTPKTMNDAWKAKNKEYGAHQKMNPIKG
eukprot:jgi/Bigna1/62334/fgenesh1_kg.33_\